MHPTLKRAGQKSDDESTPAEARPTEAAMKNAFSDYVIWLEDREHNRVEIPKS
jgi:hypothetical protein